MRDPVYRDPATLPALSCLTVAMGVNAIGKRRGEGGAKAKSWPGGAGQLPSERRRTDLPPHRQTRPTPARSLVSVGHLPLAGTAAGCHPDRCVPGHAALAEAGSPFHGVCPA